MSIILSEYRKPSLLFEIIIFIFSTISIILNSLVLYVTKLRYKSNKAIDSQLLILIGILDLILGLFLFISQIIKWTLGAEGSEEFEQGTWCKASAVLFNSAAILALVLTAQLGAIRYFTIVKGYKIKNLTSTIITIFVFIWIIAVFAVGAIQDTYGLMASDMFCIIMRDKDMPIYHNLYSAGVFLIALPAFFSIPLFYGLISNHYYKLTQALKPDFMYDTKSSFFKSSYIIYLFLFTGAYFVSFLPELVLLVVEAAYPDYHRDHLTDCIIFTLFFLECIINPLFVLTLHTETRLELLALLKGAKTKTAQRDVSSFKSLESIELKGEP